MSYVAILAGGQGSRLWPLSTKEKPKQFTDPLGEGKTLLQSTIERARMFAAEERILIVGSPVFQDEAWESCTRINHIMTYLYDPALGTAVAIGLIAQHLARGGKGEETVIILPVDHWIPDSIEFSIALAFAKREAEESNRLVLLGKIPDRTVTQYGFILPGQGTANEVRGVAGFAEKPALAEAERLTSGGALWNMGIVVGKARVVLEEMERHANPAIVDMLQEIKSQGGVRLQGKTPMESFDREILEKSDNVSVISYPGDWSDLGDWSAVHDVVKKIAGGDSTITITDRGNVQAVDCSNCHIRASHGKRVLTVGAHNLVIIVEEDDVLVIDLNKTEEARHAERYLEGK